MYLDPYKITHVFCGNFSFLGGRGRGQVGGGCLYSGAGRAGYSKRSCPLVWARMHVKLRGASSTTSKKQLWCLIISPHVYMLYVYDVFFRSLFVFLCCLGSQPRRCCTTRGASLNDFNKPIKERGARGSPSHTSPRRARWRLCHRQTALT